MSWFDEYIENIYLLKYFIGIFFEKNHFFSSPDWQPEMYIKMVLLPWNVGSILKIDFEVHLIFYILSFGPTVTEFATAL